VREIMTTGRDGITRIQADGWDATTEVSWWCQP